MIKAVVFDLDNTLVDFMAMKRQAIDAAIGAMRDAGFKLPADSIRRKIDDIYKHRGIEFQNVFDQLLYDEFSKIDYKILSAGIIAYRRARAVNSRFAQSWGLAPVELAPFSTDRFLLEVNRLEEHCSRDFRSATSLLMRGRRALAAPSSTPWPSRSSTCSRSPTARCARG